MALIKNGPNKLILLMSELFKYVYELDLLNFTGIINIIISTSYITTYCVIQTTDWYRIFADYVISKSFFTSVSIVVQ